MDRNSFTHEFADSLNRLLILALAAGLVLGYSSISAAQAASFSVSSTADAVDANPGDGACATATSECTLRAAIMEANALPGDDTISLPAGIYTLTIVGENEDAAATGDLDIVSNLTINGAGPSTTVIDASGIDRVLHVVSGSTVCISDMTIRGGNAGLTTGGGISNGGALTLVNITVSGNRAIHSGGIANVSGGMLMITNSTVNSNVAGSVGGIGSFFGSTLMMTNSAVSDNEADNGGGIGIGGNATLNNSTVNNNLATRNNAGGINNGGTLTITNSTISGNNAADGGGGISNGGRLTITNSTISGNSTASTGGGIVNGGTLMMINSTVSGNSSEFLSGGGIYQVGGSGVTLQNSIIAGNTAPSSPDCGGQIYSGGYNLIGDTSGCTFEPTNGDLVNVNPQLGPLEDNGGPTLTQALLPGSPGIDAGNPAPPGSGGNACEATDQRGITRPQREACDIGAFELEAPTMQFPQTPVLDDFNRENGRLGASWRGLVSPHAYKILNQQVDVGMGGPVYWKSGVFGADQEAFVTLAHIDPDGLRQGLLLKVQGNTWHRGALAVYYHAAAGKVEIETYVPRQGKRTLTTFDMALKDGDQLGGRAEADGMVRAFVNGVEIGSVDAGSFFVGKGGHVGLMFVSANEAVLDDFGGGDHTTTITATVTVGTDDAGLEFLDCGFATFFNEIYFGHCIDGSPIVSGFRFQGVQVPAGASILEAHLEFVVDGLYDNEIAVDFFGERSANALTFADTDRPSDRPLTAASVPWVISTSDVWDSGQSRRSPDLTTVVREIVNLPGWASENSMAVIVRADPDVPGTTHRRVFAWERQASASARLVVIYTAASAPMP